MGELRDMKTTKAPTVKAGAAVLIGLLLAVLINRDSDPDLMDGWYAYDYRAGLDVEPAVNVFHESTRVDDAVWVDDRRWSIDDPESPPSVLALVRYEKWDTSSGIVRTAHTVGDDLRGRAVCFDLQGVDLDLRGAEVTFWIMSSSVAQRWHTTIPIRVGDGEWVSNRVEVDDGRWRNSWRHDPATMPALSVVLERANSYGVGFVGFDGEPTGQLGMRDFRVC